MRAIFISYRRDDAEGQAGRLFNDLTLHFGADAVFMDVAGLEPGRDFRRAIDQQLASCGVLLAIIGKNWINPQTESGERRLDDPLDFVRLEIASALKRDIPVVPVLVQGAKMPRAEDLPEDLKELAFRNGVELTHQRWDSDVQVLIKALLPHMGVKQELSSPPPQSKKDAARPSPITARAIFAGLVCVLILVACGVYLWQKKSSPKYGSLVGNWVGSPDCTVIVLRDDGKNIEGSCDTPSVRHSIKGAYSAPNHIEVIITRIDSTGCKTYVDGLLTVESDGVMELSQAPWSGCGITVSGPIKLFLRRS